MIKKEEIEFDYSALEAYSGYYADDTKLLQSASGGGATVLAEYIIRRGGVVFGVKYSEDFKNAEYCLAEKTEDLDMLKGSKYVYANKIVKINEEYVSVYSLVADKLRDKRPVLFIGLGCDVAALHGYIEKQKLDKSILYTIDLICTGPTYAEVGKQYIQQLEERYGSKITDFSVRYKDEGWRPFYINAKFQNGRIHKRTFGDSDYGYAFELYGMKGCYECKFRGENHCADITLGDYWGIVPGKNGYNPNGVSLFIVKTQKGKSLLEEIDREEFRIEPADIELALRHNPMYYKRKEKNAKWQLFDETFKKRGLKEAVRACRDSKKPSHICGDINKYEIVLWGAGKGFYRNYAKVEEICDVDMICDNNPEKWGKEILPGITCISPDELIKIPNVFVVIMLQDIKYAFRVANQLLDMGIDKFDILDNWLEYMYTE